MSNTVDRATQLIIDELVRINESLRVDNDRLRAELAQRTIQAAPISLLNDLRRGLDDTAARLRQTERWR